MEKGPDTPYNWQGTEGLPARRWRCGWCGSIVSTSRGYQEKGHGLGVIYPCSHCGRPTYLEKGVPHPGEPYGENVEHLPGDVEQIYAEVRKCMSAGAHTAAVLACRKMLMHVAVGKGAEPGKSFVEYVDHLATQHYIPPGAVGWVDHIRTRGNELNHEINIADEADAKGLVDLVAMLLKLIYEYPAKAPQPGGGDDEPATEEPGPRA